MQRAAKGSCTCQRGCGCGTEQPVGPHSFPAVLPAGKAPAGPSNSGCWDVQSHRSELFAAPLSIPLLSTLWVTKWTLWNTLSQKIHLWYFLKQHCLLDIISVNLAFWLLDMPENSHFSTLFLLLLSCCIYSRWKPDVILLRELSFLKGNIHQGRSRRCSFAVNYLNFSFFFLLNRKSKKMYLKAIVLWLQNKSHLP